jgi:hypothetical protein
MLKTKLNMAVASALMVGGLIAAFGASVQAAPILAGPQTVFTTDSTTLGSGTQPVGGLFPDSSLCMFDAAGDPGGCAKQRLTGSVNYSYTSTNAMTLGANTFNGTAWTISNLTFLAPGTYTNLMGVASYDMTVGANQLGATMNFAWGANTGMRVISLWNIDDSTPGTRKLRPVDADGDGIVGAKMVDVFTGQSPVFNITTTVPVPAAAWLFGSGLLGLVGVARRRNKAAA